MPAVPSSRRVKRRRGARVIVLAQGDDGLEVLLQGDTDPGIAGSRFWQTPGGGIDDGESARAAAARELQEETGLAVAPEDLGAPVATRTVTHGYSDRILIQHETYFRLITARFTPRPTGLTPSEVRRRVETGWFRLDELPADVWPAQLARLALLEGDAPVDLGDVEESTVPVKPPSLP